MSEPTADPVVRQLQALAREYPDLSEAAGVYATLLPIVHAADLRVAPLALTPDEVHAKLAGGVPLLQGVDLTFDEEATCRLMGRLTQSLEDGAEANEKKPGRRATARQIRGLLEQGKVKAAALLQGVRAGDQAQVVAWAEEWQLDAGLLWLLAKHALTPALRACARELTPLAGRVDWHRSDCFVCGAEALLGELQGNTAEKHLRCGQCGADWAYPHLQCVFCGNEDHRTLSHFYFEGQHAEKRVDVCDECKGYLKVITTFAPTLPELLIVQDLATVPLDYVAQAQGYIRGGRRGAAAAAPGL